MGAVWEALTTAAGLFWRAFWALALGYAISASIQVFLSRGEAAKYLGDAKPKKVGLAMLLGFASSPKLARAASEGSVMNTFASAAQRCGCHAAPTEDAVVPALEQRHRVARIVAGGGFAAVAWLCSSTRTSRPLAVVAGWFALSHVVAGITAYPGCPELGAIPSVVRGRPVVTGCGPWKLLDARIDRFT